MTLIPGNLLIFLVDGKWLIGTVIGAAAFCLTQLGILIWFLAGLSNNVKNMGLDVQQLGEGMKALADQDKRLAVHEQRIKRIEDDIQEIRRELGTLSRTTPHVG